MIELVSNIWAVITLLLYPSTPISPSVKKVSSGSVIIIRVYLNEIKISVFTAFFDFRLYL